MVEDYILVRAIKMIISQFILQIALFNKIKHSIKEVAYTYLDVQIIRAVYINKYSLIM